jgi:hypothetical protein
MERYSASALETDGFIRRWKVARKIKKVVNLFEVLNASSDPPPTSKKQTFSIGLSHK